MLYLLIIIFLLMSLRISRDKDVKRSQRKFRILIFSAISTLCFEIFWYYPKTPFAAGIVAYGDFTSGMCATLFLNYFLLHEVGIIREGGRGRWIYFAALSPYILLYLTAPLTGLLYSVTDSGSITYDSTSFYLFVPYLLVILIMTGAIVSMRKYRGVDEKQYQAARTALDTVMLITVICSLGWFIIPDYFAPVLGFSIGIGYYSMRKNEDIIAEGKAQVAAMEAELNSARSIQMSLLPHKFPAFPDRTDFDIQAAVYPCTAVGGDYYDYYMPDSDHLVITMADVSGHGMPAALFMASTKSILKSSYEHGLTAAETLARANDAISSDNDSASFITAWLGILELSTGKLQCANAGHVMPVIRRAGGKFKVYDDGEHGIVIGVFPGMEYMNYEIQLKPGDSIFMYTDGIPEAESADGRILGTDGMIRMINDIEDSSVRGMLPLVYDRVAGFTEGTSQSDDITMLYLEYIGNRGK